MQSFHPAPLSNLWLWDCNTDCTTVEYWNTDKDTDCNTEIRAVIQKYRLTTAVCDKASGAQLPLLDSISNTSVLLSFKLAQHLVAGFRALYSVAHPIFRFSGTSFPKKVHQSTKILCCFWFLVQSVMESWWVSYYFRSFGPYYPRGEITTCLNGLLGVLSSISPIYFWSTNKA